MWTVANRARYDRSKLRYPSDLTDEEWAELAKVPPAPQVESQRRGWCGPRFCTPSGAATSVR